MSFLIIVVLSSLACLAVSIPTLTFIGSIVWGVLLVLGGYYLKSLKLILVFIINLLVLYQFIGTKNMILPVIVVGIPSLLMGILLARGKGYYELQKWGVVSAVLCVCIFMGISYYSFGAAGIHSLQMAVESYIQQVMDASKNSDLVQFYKNYGISWQEMENTFKQLGRSLILHLPAIYSIQSIIAVLIILFTAAVYTRRKGLEILSKKPFREEIMPWQLAWAVIIGLSLWLLGRDDMAAIYYVGSNILLVLAPVTIYYGLAAMTYKVGKMSPRAKRWTIVILIILSLVFAVSVLIFIGLLGLFDSLLDYRKLRSSKEE